MAGKKAQTTPVLPYDQAVANGDTRYKCDRTCPSDHKNPERYVKSKTCCLCAKAYQTAKTEARPPKRPNYLNNKDMLAEVIKSKAQGKMTDKFASMMVLLTKKYAKKGNFAGYTYNDDMQGHSLLQITKTWASFNPEKSSNPFAYYTQCIKNGFIQYLNIESKQSKIRDGLSIDAGLLPTWSAQVDYELQQRLDRDENKTAAQKQKYQEEKKKK